MDYLEQRFRRKEVLHSLIAEIRVANTSLDQRKEVGHLEERKSRVLLPRRHYGLPGAEGQRSDGVTHYTQDGAPPGPQIPARRQQSLPSRRTESDDKQRHVNSAPSRKNRSQSQKPPLPTVNNLVAKSRGPGGETSHILTTNFAGFSTKDQEASPTRCSRFASTWAQVRAENHIDMCATTSPEGQNRRTGQGEGKSEDRQPADKTAARSDGTTSRSPNREDSKGNRYQGVLDPAFHGPSPDREQTKPEKYRARQDPAHAKAKKGEKSKKQTTRSKHVEDETVLQMSDVPKENIEVQGAKHDTKRPEWNNSLAIVVPQTSPTPVTSWRRYEAELTHVPTVTSTQQVYKAYTGSYKQQLPLRNVGDDNDYELSENTPSAEGLQHKGRSREDKRPDSGTPREHVLTRNEAQMFLHLQNVYGSEAYRQQRKEMFFKKLTDVQLTELQQQDADRRRKQQRIQESRRRQKRQLMYVRRKFRKEQVHRFRTQYVTSRVLEYEKADRNMYGLPRDWNGDDFIDLDSDDDIDEEDLHGEDVKRKDSFPYDEGSGRKKAKNVNGKSTEGRQTKSTKFGKASEKSITGDKSKLVVLESKASADNDPLNSEPSSKDKTNAADPKSSSSKTCVHVPLTQPNAQKSASSRIITETSKKNPTKNQDGDCATLKLTENAIPSSNDDRHRSGNMVSACTDKAEHGVVTPKNLSKNPKGGQEQSKTAKNVTTAARRPTESNRLKAADVPTAGAGKPTKDASPSRMKNTGASTGAISTHQSARTENEANVAKITASLSKPTISVREDNKPESEATGKTSESIGNNNRNSYSRKQDQNDSAQRNKNLERKPEKTVNSNNNKDECATKDINNENNNNNNKKGRDRSIDGNKQATISGKGRHATTTKKSDVQVPSGERTSGTAFSKDNTLNGPDVGSFHREPSSSLAAGTSSNTKKADRNKSSASRRRDFQKRKPAQAHFTGEAEQKNHLERQYGKMFEMNAGPTWNPGARPPKMEGIDTVLIKVKDKKGRTRLKKKEVKDVVKEAKAQLTQPDFESLRQAGGKGDKSDQHIQQGIRPASADTLDFDDDEDDDEEDVFERVRRKYNLQIDSDGDESMV